MFFIIYSEYMGMHYLTTFQRFRFSTAVFVFFILSVSHFYYINMSEYTK